MGIGGEDSDKDGVNVTGTGYGVQGSRAVGVVIWEKYMVGYGGYDKFTRGIPSFCIKKDCGNYGAAYDERRVVVAPGG